MLRTDLFKFKPSDNLRYYTLSAREAWSVDYWFILARLLVDGTGSRPLNKEASKGMNLICCVELGNWKKRNFSVATLT
jgi:hypothetical protein